MEPSSGTIAPGASAEVKVQYCSGKLSTLRDVKDVRCKISEPLTGEVRIVRVIDQIYGQGRVVYSSLNPYTRGARGSGC